MSKRLSRVERTLLKNGAYRQLLLLFRSMSDVSSLEKLQPELFPSEKLLWHGRPVQGFLPLRQSDFWGFFFGTLLLGAVLFLILQIFDLIPIPGWWQKGISTQEAKIACVIWSVILLPVALYWLGGSQWLDARARRHLFYGVTNERILVLRDQQRNSQALTSLRIQDVPHLSIQVDGDGTGYLIFALHPTKAPNQPLAYGVNFRLIPEVRKVYTLIRSIQREAA